MPYVLKVPAVMRVFKPLPVSALCLGDTHTCMDEGEVLKVSVVCIATYNHDVRLAIQFIHDSAFYLLVEELCEESEDLAFKWRDLYKEYIFAKIDEERKEAERSIEVLYEKFRPLLRKYIRPKLRVVHGVEDIASFSEATSVRPVPLLHT